MGYVGRGLNQTGGQYRKIDDISSGFDGSETSFTLKVSGVDITPTAQNVLISINGVIQEPGSAYSMNGSTITFTGAPDGAANFFGIVMGEASYIAFDTVGANEMGVTAGHVSASHGVVVDSSKNVTGFNQVTSTTFSGIFSGALSSSAQIASNISGSLSNSAIGALGANIVSASVLSSPSQGTVRLALNGVNTDVDSGLQSGDSPTFAGGTITGDFSVGGTITAQEVHTEFESASILFTSGSTQFGNSLDDNHVFSGSLLVTGSLVQLRGGSTKLRFSNDAGAERAFLQLNGTGLNIDTDSFIDFKPNNTFAARFDSNGRLGIGTDNPDGKLHIHDGSAGSVTANGDAANLVIESSATGADTGLSILSKNTRANQIFFGDEDDNDIGAIGYVHNGNYMFFRTNTSERFRITSAGKGHFRDEFAVGTGVSSGYGVLGLISEETGSTRYGSIRKNYDSPYDFRVRASNSDSEAALVFDGSNDTEYARFDTSGNLGIGTATPLATLHVEHTTDDTDENGNIALTVGGGASGAVRHYWGINNSSNYAYYGAVEHGTQYVPLVLQPNGSNVGIGTTSPGVKLDVDSGASSDIVKFQNDSSTSGLVIGYTSNLCSFDLAASQALRIRQAGGVPFLLNTNGVMDGDFNDTSDIALKKNINDLSDTLQGVKNLKPSTFQWIDELKGDKTKIGFIAQDVEEQFPELVDGEDGRKSINTIGLVSVLTKTIQDLIKRIEELEK